MDSIMDSRIVRFEDGFEDGFGHGFEHGFGDGFKDGFEHRFKDGSLLWAARLFSCAISAWFGCRSISSGVSRGILL